MRSRRSRGQTGEQGRPGAAAVGQREFEVFEDRQVLENGRPLKLSADAEIGDLSLVEAAQIRRPLKEDLAGIGPGLAGDHIHHRRLAGAVRADDRAQFALLDDQRKPVQRLEPVEADGDAVEVEQGLGRRPPRVMPALPPGRERALRGRVQRACRRRPTIPRGNTSVVSDEQGAEHKQPGLGRGAGQPGLCDVDEDRAEDCSR